MNPLPVIALTWQTVGLVLALVLLFSIGLAVVTRQLMRHGPDGQLFILVAAGVGGVLGIAGLVVGYAVVGILVGCFVVAAVPMGYEYYSRIIAAEKAARLAQEKMVSDVHPGADR
jgi:hypothetical protein